MLRKRCRSNQTTVSSEDASSDTTCSTRSFPVRHWKGSHCVNYVLWDGTVGLRERQVFHRYASLRAQQTARGGCTNSLVKLVVIQDVTHPACGQYGLVAAERIGEGTAVLAYTGVVQTQIRMPTSQRFTIALGASLKENKQQCMSDASQNTRVMRREEDMGSKALVEWSDLQAIGSSLPPHTFLPQTLASMIHPEIDAEYMGNFARFVNDPRSTGRRVNLIAVQRYTLTGQLYTSLESARTIEAGEELLLSYGSKFSLDPMPVIGPDHRPVARLRGKAACAVRFYNGTIPHPLRLPAASQSWNPQNVCIVLMWLCPQCNTQNHLPTNREGQPQWIENQMLERNRQRVPGLIQSPSENACTSEVQNGASVTRVPAKKTLPQCYTCKYPYVMGCRLTAAPVPQQHLFSGVDPECPSAVARNTHQGSPSTDETEPHSADRGEDHAMGAMTPTIPDYVPVAWPSDFAYTPWIIWHPHEPLEMITALSPHISQPSVSIQETSTPLLGTGLASSSGSSTMTPPPLPMSSSHRRCMLCVTQEVKAGERLCFCGGVLSRLNADQSGAVRYTVAHGTPSVCEHVRVMALPKEPRESEPCTKAQNETEQQSHVSFRIELQEGFPPLDANHRQDFLSSSGCSPKTVSLLLRPTNEVCYVQDVAMIPIEEDKSSVEHGDTVRRRESLINATLGWKVEPTGELTFYLEARRTLHPGECIWVDTGHVLRI